MKKQHTPLQVRRLTLVNFNKLHASRRIQGGIRSDVDVPVDTLTGDTGDDQTFTGCTCNGDCITQRDNCDQSLRQSCYPYVCPLA
jgi:hypothetical protein